MKRQTLKPYHAKTFARNKSDTGKRGLVKKINRGTFTFFTRTSSTDDNVS